MRRFRLVKNLTLIVVPGTEIAKSVTVTVSSVGWLGETVKVLSTKARTVGSGN